MGKSEALKIDNEDQVVSRVEFLIKSDGRVSAETIAEKIEKAIDGIPEIIGHDVVNLYDIDNNATLMQEASNVVVHVYKSGTGNSNYTSKTVKEAIKYVKDQNLDLSQDYFDIHTGSNTSELDGLFAWGGVNGYWANVALKNTKAKAKEIESLDALHESDEDYYWDKSKRRYDDWADSMGVENKHYYLCKSLLADEKDLPARKYTELEIRQIYASYLQDEREVKNVSDPAELNELYAQIKKDSYETPIEEIVNYLNNKGDMEVTELTEETVAVPEDGGTIASCGEAPTVVAGKGVVEVKPTKCEELVALQEALKD